MLKIIPNHLAKNLQRWKGKQWYHQRFDGSPYLLHYIAEAEVKEEPRKLGCCATVRFCFFDHDVANWYIPMDDIKKDALLIIEAGKKNSVISKKLMADWKKDEEAFYQKCAEIEKTHFGALSDKELRALHDAFLGAAILRNSSSSVIDHFALGTDEFVAEKIRKAHEQSSLKDAMKFTEVFSILTAPVHLSFINYAEVALLKAAAKIKKDPSKKEMLLSEHQQNYFWIRNNYVDANVLGVAYFGEELNKIFSLNLNIEEEIRKIETTPTVNKQKKAELMKKMHCDDELKLLITVSEDFTHWQDERKKATFWASHYATMILNEISKRTGIPTLLIKYASPREIGNVMNGTLTQKTLGERQKNCAFYWDIGGHDCVVGKEADDVKDTILGSTELSDIDDFRGLTACMGKATGTVKVVKSAKEIDKVEEGDIIVAVMTRPDYVPAMKRAAAIVTDEGGVTCHAAIVSRELNIPCIIGTKIATKALKDGDCVEVNANHGWVRKVKLGEEHTIPKEKIFAQTKTRWYAQGINCTPILLSPPGLSGFDLKPVLGDDFKSFLFEYNEEYGKMHYPVDDLRRLGKIIVDKIRNDKNFLKKIREADMAIQEAKIKELHSIPEEKFSNLFDTQLYMQLQKAVDAMREIGRRSHLIEPFSLTTDIEIKEKLVRFIKDTKEMNECLALLSTPLEKSFINEREEDLHHISLIKTGAEKKKAIEAHLKKFYWVRNTYCRRQRLTVKDIDEEIKTVHYTPIDFELLKAKKEQALKKVPDKELVMLLEASAFITGWQDWRKKIILIEIDYVEGLLAEISKRCGITHSLLRYFTHNEVMEKFMENVFAQKTTAELITMLTERRNGMIQFVTPEGEGILVGDEYKKFQQEMSKKEKNQNELTQFSGLTASTGTAIGPVKICRTLADIHAVKEGEVLVASMTRPEYLPAMKKACAIVTDEGGITSHAAIVSRELGKPCVIGTKIATQVLKDGDIVEVKANHGVVIIHKRQ